LGKSWSAFVDALQIAWGAKDQIVAHPT